MADTWPFTSSSICLCSQVVVSKRWFTHLHFIQPSHIDGHIHGRMNPKMHQLWCWKTHLYHTPHMLYQEQDKKTCQLKSAIKTHWCYWSNPGIRDYLRSVGSDLQSSSKLCTKSHNQHQLPLAHAEVLCHNGKWKGTQRVQGECGGSFTNTRQWVGTSVKGKLPGNGIEVNKMKTGNGNWF